MEAEVKNGGGMEPSMSLSLEGIKQVEINEASAQEIVIARENGFDQSSVNTVVLDDTEGNRPVDPIHALVGTTPYNCALAIEEGVSKLEDEDITAVTEKRNEVCDEGPAATSSDDTIVITESKSCIQELITLVINSIKDMNANSMNSTTPDESAVSLVNLDDEDTQEFVDVVSVKYANESIHSCDVTADDDLAGVVSELQGRDDSQRYAESSFRVSESDELVSDGSFVEVRVSSLSDEVAESEEAVDDIIILDENDETMEFVMPNDSRSLSPGTNSSTNFSVDVLDDGQLIAKTEIEIEEEYQEEPMTADVRLGDLETVHISIENGNSKPVQKKQPIKKARTRKVTAASITDQPVYRVPMEHGWMRELVVRAGNMHKKADVYYYPPTGGKLRSMREVETYLIKNNVIDLSPTNFIYRTETVNSSNEIIRIAKRKCAQLDAQPPAKKKEKVPKKIAPKKSAKFLVTYENLVNANTPTTIDSQEIVSSFRLSPPPRESHEELMIPSENASGVETSTDQNANNVVRRCTHRCPGQEGRIPSLHCNKCLCLFHPDCVGISNLFACSPNFTCQECGGGEVNLRKHVQTSLVKLMSPDTTLQWSVNNYPIAFPLVVNDDFQKAVPVTNTLTGTVVQRLPSSVNLLGSAQMSANDCGNIKRFPCGVTIEKVMPGNRTNGGGVDPSTDVTAAISVISVTTPSTNLQSNNRNDTLRLPPLPQPSTPSQPRPAFVEGTPRSVLRPVIIPSSGSAFPLLKNAIMKYTTPMRPQVARRNLGAFAAYQNNIRPVLSQSPNVPSIRPSLRPETKQPCPSQPKPIQQTLASTEHGYTKPKKNLLVMRSIAKSTASENHAANQSSADSRVNALNCGILSLIAVFKYFTVGDILRASQVCRAWQILLRLPAVWETVVLKDVKVTDWDIFIRTAKSLSTHHLDTREMIVDGTEMSAFEGLMNAMTALTDLKSLILCESPPALAYAAADRLPLLKHFSSEWMVETSKDQMGVSCTVNIDQFASMSNLESLRLRGINGLNLHKRIGSFDRFRHLKKLTCLVMTSLKDVPSAECEFLNELSNLTTLEFGECVNWTEKVYIAVSRIQNLRNLRLEFGGEFAERGIEIILSSLTNLVRLELITFRIPSNFGDLLSPLKKLHQLTVWPDLNSKPEQNNYYTVKAAKQIPFVKIMIWGLVMSNLMDPILGVPGQVDHNSCCVPFLNCEPSSSTSTLPSTRTHISAHQIMNKLRGKMPHSKVQVVMVPNESYMTLCYMPR